MRAKKTNRRDGGETASANKRKVLFFDIECAGVSGLSSDRGFVCCFGYRWEGEKSNVITLADYPGKNCQDDKRLIMAAHEIMCQADILVAHFGEKFDRPYVDGRLIFHGLEPLSNSRLIDTCLISRSRFKLSSHRLANLAIHFGCENKKMEKRSGEWPGWWMGVLRGDVKSLRDMAEYCAQDVDTLHDVYYKMLPWIPAKYLLNFNLDKRMDRCSGCGGNNLQRRGYYFAEKSVWRKFQCRGCGRWGKSHKPLKNEDAALVGFFAPKDKK